VQLHGARKQQVILPGDAAHAMDEPVDFVDERLQQRPGFVVDGGQQRTQRDIGRPAQSGGERADAFLAPMTGILSPLGGFLDGLDELQEAAGIAVENALLLFLEQAQQATVFLNFVAQAIGDLFPNDVHGDLAAGV
jgi:hypothetical protein